MTNHPIHINHTHQPVYRVVRQSWSNPLDATFSQRSTADNRWNTEDFPALYCCCSEQVAAAVAQDILEYAGVEISDLDPSMQPRLVEISWSGRLVDMATAQGVRAAEFPHTYPRAVDKRQTRAAARQWNTQGVCGVVCRSASLSWRGVTTWSGNHERWAETALFVQNCARPTLVKTRDDLGWLEDTKYGAGVSPTCYRAQLFAGMRLCKPLILMVGARGFEPPTP